MNCITAPKEDQRKASAPRPSQISSQSSTAGVMQMEAEPLLPIPVATEKRPDPRLALTIGVAGWIADPKDFGKPPLVDLVVTVSALHLLDWYILLDWYELMHAST